jgi:hypothetical protein
MPLSRSACLNLPILFPSVPGFGDVYVSHLFALYSSGIDYLQRAIPNSKKAQELVKVLKCTLTRSSSGFTIRYHKNDGAMFFMFPFNKLA